MEMMNADKFGWRSESRPDLAARDAEYEDTRAMLRQAQKQQDKKLLKYCLIATLLVSPIIGLTIWHDIEAKACGDRIECQF